jgi:hypothetical protein
VPIPKAEDLTKLYSAYEAAQTTGNAQAEKIIKTRIDAFNDFNKLGKAEDEKARQPTLTSEGTNFAPELAKKEEKRFSIQSQLAQAERAEKAAAATYGLQSEEAARAGREANRLAKLGYKANLASDKAKGEFEASKANVQADVETAKLGEEKRYHDLWYSTNMAKVNKDASTLEKSIRSNETAQLKALLSESGDRLDSLRKAPDFDPADPLYVKSLEIYNGAANALGLKSGVKTTPVAPNVRATTPEAKSKLRSILGM